MRIFLVKLEACVIRLSLAEQIITLPLQDVFSCMANFSELYVQTLYSHLIYMVSVLTVMISIYFLKNKTKQRDRLRK